MHDDSKERGLDLRKENVLWLIIGIYSGESVIRDAGIPEYSKEMYIIITLTLSPTC